MAYHAGDPADTTHPAGELRGGLRGLMGAIVAAGVRLWVRHGAMLGLAVIALYITAVAAVGWLRPVHAWDMIAYLAAALRDRYELAGALHAAETGHLVIVQVHAGDAREAVERIVSAAPEGMQAKVQKQLAETLRGITVQRLARHNDGRVRTAIYDVIGEGARKFAQGGTPDAGFYICRAQDGIKQLEDDGKIDKEEAERLRREVGA